jgi:hypothetical protein
VGSAAKVDDMANGGASVAEITLSDACYDLIDEMSQERDVVLTWCWSVRERKLGL